MEFALVLHAHLPYVRPTGAEILEERWLYEAIAETYIPLLWGLERLQHDQVPARLAISFSGPLLSMMSEAGLMERCRDHLVRTARLAAREALRCKGTDLEPAAAFHARRFADLVADLDTRGGDLLGAFRTLSDAGIVELFTAAGTHGYLPLLATDTGRTAQIEAGLQEFERIFGRRPAGLWLPECAYAPGLDHLLSAAGIRWFMAESATLGAAWPPVPGAACVRTPGGVAAFGRDVAAARQVWDSRAGYPGAPEYREFYKDQGYDLPLPAVAPWLVEGRVRSDTGLKYYSVTGEVALDRKRPYNPDWAMSCARDHARHYARQLAERRGLVVTPFDAELFGHWWFEGTYFLESLFREIAALGGKVRPVSPTDYLESAPPPPLVRLPAGSWGVEGNHTFWLAPANDFVWPQLHDAELRMIALAADPAVPKATVDEAARQLLLAQASDWPFIIAGGTTVEYARHRVCKHLERFDAIVAGHLSPESLDDDHRCFPALSGRFLYGSRKHTVDAGQPLRILMLSWEFPPANVGGLGRHVMDLGEALVEAGHTVHVITLADEMSAAGTERVAGMTVHRVARPPEGGNFISWVYQFNLDLVQAALRVSRVYGAFDVVHGHDWLVGQAGMALQARWHTPLVATIHATERGRNAVIREPMQEAIHAEEWQLTAAADAVVTVSQAMAQEVAASFQVTPTVIHNGVKLDAAESRLPRPLKAPYFFYIGRLVVEKGVQVAIRALAQVPGAHLVVAGKGPLEAELKSLARELGVAGRVLFVGRVSDAEKAAWLRHAVGGLVPSLYEPFGITALEVMSAGAPVIVGDTGGLAEIVTDGADGLKVPPGHVDALAAAMAGLLANPGLARQIGTAGQRTAAERFAWPAIARQTLQVYTATLNERVHV